MGMVHLLQMSGPTMMPWLSLLLFVRVILIEYTLKFLLESTYEQFGMYASLM